MTEPAGDAATRRPRRTLIALGALLAFGAPLAQIAVAWLWSEGAISPDPNGPLVQALEYGGFSLQLLVAPVGIWLIGAGARISTAVGWIVLFALASPLAAALWFVGSAWLGGLAGEPF